MNAKEHPTYRFLMERQKMEPGRPIFLIVAGKPLLAQLNEEEDDELQLFDLKVSTDGGKTACWREDNFHGLEFRVCGYLAEDTQSSIKWLIERSKKFEGGAFYITSSLDIDPEADGATSMGKATARGALELWGEWDDITREEQLKQIDKLDAMGLECHRNTSGGSSVHWHIPFNELVCWEDAMPLLQQVTALMGSDVCCVSKARRMRLPGLFRRGDDGVVKEQELLHLTEQRHSLEKVKATLAKALAERGWQHSPRRWSLYRSNNRRKAAGFVLTNGWDTPEEAFTCATAELFIYKGSGNDAADSDGRSLPPMWLRTEHHRGKDVRRLQDKLLEQRGVVGAYELAVNPGRFGKQKKAADGQAPFTFDFTVRTVGPDEHFPEELNGCSPFSETNHTGSSFVVWGKRWFCRKTHESGMLAQLLLWACPGVSDPEEPSETDQKRLVLWMTDLAGENVEQAAQKFEDGKYGDEMQLIEEIVLDSLDAEGNKLEMAAIEQRAAAARISATKLFELKMHALEGSLRSSGVVDAGKATGHPDNIDGDVIHRLLYRGQHLGLVGDSTSGKTTLACFLISRVLLGHNLIISGKPHHIRKGKVLICSSDAGVEGVKSDLRKQGVDADDPKWQPWLKFLDGVKYDRMTLITKTLQEFQPDLVFFDSLTSMNPSGVKLSDEACSAPLYYLTRGNGQIWPRNCLITAIHTKKGEERVWLGSNTIRAALDSLGTYAMPAGWDEETDGPTDDRVLSFKGSMHKCRLGNRGREFSITYDDRKGSWNVDELNTSGKTSLSAELRMLIERKPWRTWKRLGEVLDQIGASKDYSSAATKRAISRHLQTLEDLIETREEGAGKKTWTEYRVTPTTFAALQSIQEGTYASNLIGVSPKPLGYGNQAGAAEDSEEQDQTPAQKPAAASQKVRAPRPSGAPKHPGRSKTGSKCQQQQADERPPLVPVSSTAIEESNLLRWSPMSPPAPQTPMAVFDGAEWLNGWIYRKMHGEKVELARECTRTNTKGTIVEGGWYSKRFPADCSVVRQVKKEAA